MIALKIKKLWTNTHPKVGVPKNSKIVTPGFRKIEINMPYWDRINVQHLEMSEELSKDQS